METDRAALLDVVKRAARIADRRPVMPILGNLRLAAEGGELAIEATRLSVSGRFTLPCQGDLAPALVPAERLVAVLAGAGGERAVIEPLRKGWVAVRAGTAAYRVASIDARDWPAQAGEVGAAAHPASGAADAIRRVLPCASTDETRPHICGVLLLAEDGGLAAVATDGHKLGYWRAGAWAGEAGAWLVESAGADALVALEPETLAMGGGFVVGERVGARAAARVVDASFPPWRNAVPGRDAAACRFRASADALAAAIRSVAAAGSVGAWLEVEPGGVRLRASEPDVADAEDVVAGAEVTEGAAKAGFSFGVLSAAVAVGSGAPGVAEVQLGSGELDPARIDFGEAGFAVAMPMRL